MNRVGYYRLPPVRGVFFSPVQEERLLLLGCQEVFSDRCLTNAIIRPGLDKALAALQPGGTLAVLSLHALAGTTTDLMEAVLKLKARDLHLVVAQPEIDTNTDPGFFMTCETLTTFNAERAMVKAAEATLVSKGVKGGGVQGLKAGTPPSQNEPED
jgi:DNA invertase Pin-like site-specific DNA recombinase